VEKQHGLCTLHDCQIRVIACLAFSLALGQPADNSRLIVDDYNVKSLIMLMLWTDNENALQIV
jgi:hypothetical protein